MAAVPLSTELTMAKPTRTTGRCKWLAVAGSERVWLCEIGVLAILFGCSSNATTSVVAQVGCDEKIARVKARLLVDVYFDCKRVPNLSDAGPSLIRDRLSSYGWFAIDALLERAADETRLPARRRIASHGYGEEPPPPVSRTIGQVCEGMVRSLLTPSEYRRVKLARRYPYGDLAVWLRMRRGRSIDELHQEVREWYRRHGI